jgi:hypothetical protein
MQASAQNQGYVDLVGEEYGKVAALTRAQVVAIQNNAELGNPEAQLQYGMVCETRYKLLGISIGEGQAQALGWYERAAKQGNALAQRLAAGLSIGHPAAEIQWYEQAAKQGDIGSAYSLGEIYLQGILSGKPDPTEAARWFLIAAKGGDADAAIKIGSFYEDGYGVPRDDSEAAKWYRVAANQGYWPAQLALGRLYEAGQGVPRDTLQAARWYSKASYRSGDAAFNYASLIARGLITGKNRRDAEFLYRQAAKLYRSDAINGDSAAPQKLGHMYESIAGMPRSLTEAYFWYLIAKEEGSAADADVERVKLRLTSKQISDTDERVAKWLDAF